MIASTSIRQWPLASLLLLFCLTAAQTDGQVALRIRLRDAAGAPVSGEAIVLQPWPAEGAETGQPCRTDESGACAWTVGRGLYELRFERPLDQATTLAVAEGGLAGLGVTVGGEPITYHFALGDDGHLYFDGSPAAAVPHPIIPDGADMTLPAAPSPTSPPAKPEGTEAPSDLDSANSLWRLGGFVALGLLAGAAGHIWSNRRRRPSGVAASEDADA